MAYSKYGQSLAAQLKAVVDQSSSIIGFVIWSVSSVEAFLRIVSIICNYIFTIFRVVPSTRVTFFRPFQTETPTTPW